jgi:hypothetical protein
VTATRVRRSFVATPKRAAAATWEAIVDIVAPGDSSARVELNALTGIAASLIAAEAWCQAPLIVSGVGPQLRIYCLYGEDAILSDDAHEDTLTWSPTDGDWTVEIPCPPEDLEWASAAATEVSARFTVVDATVKRASEMTEAASEPANEIDAEAFLRG